MSSNSPAPYLLLWFIVNLIQSYFTELFHDEAYYWMFSQYLDWGYKDHPPAAAVFIWLGGQLFQNELGVRLLMVGASTTTLWMVWKLVAPKNTARFFLIVFSILIVNIGGFMAVPDVPLLFFTTLFLFFFKDYIHSDNWGTALLVALALTGMAYSKYHGALVLLLVLIPNIKLLKRPSAWLIPVVALVLYLPHLYWQWANDFPSFVYHFQDRGEDKYEWTFILDYIGGQLAIWGPLVSIPLFYLAFKKSATNQFEKTMQWICWGTFGFFFYQSFQQRTEANWTTVAFLPLILLAYRQMEITPNWRKWTLRLSGLSIGLIILFRIYLMWDFLPKGVNPRNEFHGWDEWAQDISDITNDRPALFFNRFQKPVKYMFYSRKPTHTQTVLFDTGTQFDLIAESEEAVQGKTVVMIVDNEKSFKYMDSVVTLPRSGKVIGFKVVDDFRSYNRLKVKAFPPEKLILPPDTTVQIPIEILNPTGKTVQWDTTGDRRTRLDYIVIQYENVYIKDWTGMGLPQTTLRPGEHIKGIATLKTPTQPGRYRYRFGFKVDDFSMGRNSRFYTYWVE